MPIIQGLGWTFDTVADTYAKFRPGYVDGVYDMIRDYIPLHAGSRAAEVGIGGGQATGPILETGCEVTAVEPGEEFSKLCEEKFRAYPRFSVITGKFEEVEFAPESFDLVYSASAFHWVPEEIGYRKVYDMLLPGGAFARFANHPHPDQGRPEMSAAIQEAYARYYYPFHHREIKHDKVYGEEQAAARAEIARRYGFQDIAWALFRRTRSFTAQEYITLLGTYSDHIVIDEPVRRKFFDEIEQTIHEYGGEITLYDTIDLALARRP